MKNLLYLWIFLAAFSVSCGEKEAIDSDFRVDPVSNPETFIRSFFFLKMENGITLVEFERPPSDTTKPGYALKMETGTADTVKVIRDKATILKFLKTFPDSITKARIKTLYFSLPGLDAHWEFPAISKVAEVNEIQLIAPPFLREGPFKAEFSAALECIKVKAGKSDTSTIVTPVKQVLMKISKE